MIPIPTNHPQTFILDNGRNVLSSPFRILSWPDQLCIPIATPNTTCFQCHGNSHYRKIAWTTSALTAVLLTPAIHLTSVSLSNVTSVATGAIWLLTAPIATVEFALPLGTSLTTVYLNVSPHSRLLPSMRGHLPLPLNSFVEWGLLIESGIWLYEGSNVTIFILYPGIFLFSYFSYQRTWRMSNVSNVSFLLLVNPNCIMLTPLSLLTWSTFHHILPCSFPFLSLSFLVALVHAQSLCL